MQGLVHGLGQVHRREPLQVRAMDHAGIAEQLVEQAAHVGGVALDRLQAAAHVLRIIIIQCQLRLRAQRGQRRTHLVRGLGHERAQGFIAGRQPPHEAVQRTDHLVHLLRRGRIQWPQIGGLAPGQLAFDPHQRPQRPVHAERDQGQRQQREHHDRDQGAGHHVLGQRLACAPGLPDLHTDFRLRGRGGDPPRHHDEAHGLAAVGRIEQLRTIGRRARRCRQVVVAGHGLVACIGDAIEHAVFRRHRQQVERGVGQIDLPLRLHQRHRIDDRQCRGHQQVIVGTIGGALAIVACTEEQRHGEQRHQAAEIEPQRAPDRARRAGITRHRDGCHRAWRRVLRADSRCRVR